MDTTNTPRNPTIVIDPVDLADAARWLGYIEDWLLHADPDHAYQLAGFLGHAPDQADLAAAALIGDIGATAVTMQRLLTHHETTNTEAIR